MRLNSSVALAVILVLGSASLASARQNDHDYTQEEQTLCQPDVFRLCNDYVPDEQQIIACMTQKRKQLSPQCAKVFDVGVSRVKH